MVFRSEKNLENYRLGIETNLESKTRRTLKKFINYMDNKSRNSIKELSTNSNNLAFGSTSERKLIYSNSFNSDSKQEIYNFNSNLIKDNYNKELNLKINNENSSKIFISKQKRFKTFNNYKNDVPGPGQYFKEEKNKKNKKKIMIRNNTSIYEPFSPNRIFSIPSKNSEDNKTIDIIHNYNSTNKNKKYFIRNKNNIYNKSSQISNDKNIFLNNNESQFDSNYINNENSTSPTINNSLSIYNYNKSNKNELDSYFFTDRNNKIFKMPKGKLYKNNTIISNHNFLKISYNNKNITPGPGAYLQLDELKGAKKSKNFQNFGSYTLRNIFPQKNHKINIFNTEEIDNYHSSNNLLAKEKNKLIKSKSLLYNLSNKKNNNKILKIKFDNNSSKEETPLKDNHNINNYINEKNNLYDRIFKLILNENIIKYKNGIVVSNKKENFGSSETRFPITTSKMVTPGPGKYSSLEGYKFPKEVNRHPLIPKNIIKQNLIGLSSLKLSIFKDKINYEKNKKPSIWQYSPEKYNSIEHDNKKFMKKYLRNKLHSIENEKIIKNKKQNKNEELSNHSEPKIEIQKAPFLTGSERSEFIKMEKKEINYDVGPGSYNSDSYFDWNKKSYNLLFN